MPAMPAMNASITLSYPPSTPPPRPTTYSIHASHPTSPFSHAIIAESATLDIPHANPWLLTGTTPPPTATPFSRIKILHQDSASGTWSSRSQSPQPYSDTEPEVLQLDDDILERDLSTGCIGRCGARGCRRDLGCPACARSETPRTTWRGCVPPPPEPPAVEVHEYPMHLQRLATATVVVEMKPVVAVVPRGVQRTGPKVKYIRKRLPTAVDRVVGRRRKTASTGRFVK